MNRQWLNRCCNPLGKANHSAKRKTLRPVTKWMFENYPEIIEMGQMICDQCRKEVYSLKNNPAHECTFEVLPGTSSEQDFEEQLNEFDYNEALDSLNSSLNILGESPISKKKLKLQKYPKEKFHKVETAVQKLFEMDDSVDDEIVQSAESEMICQLKEKFCSSTSRSEKIQILTILPKSWSIRKIAKEFEAPNFMVRKAKLLVKEKGILSSPNFKPGKSLPENVINIVREFYECDLISRMMPGQKDYVSVKDLSGNRIQKQKRLILCNLKEAYALFKQKHTDNKIGFSKFAELRPKHCVLAGASGTHSVCVCTIHQNFKLMMIGGKIAELTATDDVPLKTHKDCIALVICNPPQPACYLGDCKECEKADYILILKERLRNLMNENMVDTVTYKQWVSVDRCTLETITKSYEDFLDSFCENLKHLLRHSFIAKQQSIFQAELKLMLQPGQFLVICDFSENYSFVLQDEIQGYHWNNSQVTIHPFVAYFNDNKAILQHISFVIISECLNHDTIAFHLFQRYLINFLRSKMHPTLIKQIFYFSDGASAHYKNRKNFVNLCYHEEDFGISAEWHFTATAHGKGACDGIGGTLKRSAARASLQKPYDEQIATPKQLYEWAVLNIPSVSFKYSTINEYLNEEQKIKERLQKSRTIVGTQKLHSFIPLTKSKICTKVYSASPFSKVELVTKLEDELSIGDIKGFVTAIYDNKWWIACVIDSDEENAQVKLSFLHPSGPSPSYSFPTKPDVLLVPIHDILTVVNPTTATGRVYNISEKETTATNVKLNARKLSKGST